MPAYQQARLLAHLVIHLALDLVDVMSLPLMVEEERTHLLQLCLPRCDLIDQRHDGCKAYSC